MTTKHGINSTVESLPEDFRKYRTNNVTEVPDFFKNHKRWVEIEKVAKEMDENFHRELPGDARARKVDLLIVLVTNFATDISLSRELEYKENGKLKQKCVEWLVSFLVNCCVENGYDDERIRALIMSTGGIIDQLPITGPPKWHHDRKMRPHFEATCAKTRGPMKEMMSDLFDECPRVRDGSAVLMVLGGPAHKKAIEGDALSSGILPSEAKSLASQKGPLPHMQRSMMANITEPEQERFAKVVERMFRYLLGDPNFKLTKRMLNGTSTKKGILPCVSNATKKKAAEKHSEGYQNKSEEEKERLRTNTSIAAAKRHGNTNPFVWWKCMNDGKWAKAGRCTYEGKEGYEVKLQLPTNKTPQLRCPCCKTRDGLTAAPQRTCDTGVTRNREGNLGFLRCSCPQCDGKEGDWISDECQKRMNEEGEGDEEE